ncbi:MAG: hypothetical protein BGO70_01575 [Bacteroidetes bacterium 43-93]|nr:MAG: hypothetical protein BGO70_01575 [Bacteroidetes bacterium 43-93]
MRSIAHKVFRFLPVQLFILHFRKYQMILLFWYILFATITGHFASVFGASSLFLAPEYAGQINFFSMLLLGGATAVFIMAWHITTFIIHSTRLPFLGATRHAFLKYCINNSLLPLIYIITYSIIAIRYQIENEHAGFSEIIKFQLGFYLGFLLILLLSFAYFFRVDRDLLKVVLSRIANPALIKNLIPYDTLDYEIDIVRADTYLTGKFQIHKFSELQPYSPRLLATVLRKHHRNAITATLFALAVLLLSGIFMDDPRLRIPAGGGFLLLFSVVMGVVGAMKYFLRSWETIGWLVIIFLVSFLVSKKIFDFRSIAYGVDYHSKNVAHPDYDQDHLNKVFSAEKYQQDKTAEEHRLMLWKRRQVIQGNDSLPPLILISVSGGGSRAAYWTFRTLQYLDSISNGKLYSNTVLMTGASGGMIGAAYWRELHNAYTERKINNPYLPRYQDNVGKDLLNAIIFSFVSVDLISPFNKISVAGYASTKDRGYAMEQELITNTEGMLDKKLGDYRVKEASGIMPAMIYGATIINDGRKLLMSALPITYLTQPEYTVNDSVNKCVDAIDFATFFKDQNPYNLRVTSALRMNATFPFILPVVKLPSVPEMNLMDAGLRDNFGIETSMRYLSVLHNWIADNTRDVILLQIRDTREAELFPPSDMNSMMKMTFEPLFAIQNKWESFQSYNHSYLKDFADKYYHGKLHVINMEYIPQKHDRSAALNFHITQREKKDLAASIFNVQNMAAADSIMRLLQGK